MNSFCQSSGKPADVSAGQRSIRCEGNGPYCQSAMSVRRGEPWFADRIARCATDRYERVGNHRVTQPQGRLYDLRTKEWRAHPAAVEPFLVDPEQKILHGGAKTLNRHRQFGLLAVEVGIILEIGKIETGQHQNRRVDQARFPLFQTNLNDLLILTIELELPPPICGHGFRKCGSPFC